MILHRSRTWRIEFLLVIAAVPALAWMLLLAWRDTNAGLPAAVISREWLTFTAAAIATPIVTVNIIGRMRFRFVIGSAGLTIRTADLTAALRWSDIESIVLDDLRVLVVPNPGYQASHYPGITRLARITADGRSCFEILALSAVRESPDQIASALTEHAGRRFTDIGPHLLPPPSDQ